MKDKDIKETPQESTQPVGLSYEEAKKALYEGKEIFHTEWLDQRLTVALKTTGERVTVRFNPELHYIQKYDVHTEHTEVLKNNANVPINDWFVVNKDGK